MFRKTTPLLIALMLLAGISFSSQAQQKKRIAILDFDYATVYSDVGYIFGSNVDVGKGIADLLVTKLVQGGQYSIIERKQLDKIIAEQNLGASGRVDEATAARIGKILGVDALILGSIHTFGRDDKSRGTGGGVSVPVPVFGGVKIGSKKAKAIVGINFRLVATDTAEIFSAGDARGESKREGASIQATGGVKGVYTDGAVGMNSTNFAETIIGEAVYDCVNKLAAQLEEKAGNLPARTSAAVKSEGVIADVSGSTVIINIGRNAGLKTGDRLEVKRVSREVKDPDTGKVIRVVAEKVGEVVLTDVDDSSAEGRFSGSGAAKVKDKVVPIQ
ncbi:MAG: curli production assembly protein CsgG [Acidobacteria bacterium]|nr:curli production assembly protein CsgG [Acidobacteriota bacterium]